MQLRTHEKGYVTASGWPREVHIAWMVLYPETLRDSKKQYSEYCLRAVCDRDPSELEGIPEPLKPFRATDQL